jgi:hypothetical protein
MKYLGIYFDDKLNFYKHIGHLTEKSRKLIYMLGKTAKLNCGLGHKALKTIYEAAIAPLVTYGAPVWEEAAKKKTLLRKLQSTQSLAPSDYHLFPYLKEHLGGRFSTDDEVKEEVTRYLNGLAANVFDMGIQNLVQRLQKCLDRNGDYVEK